MDYKDFEKFAKEHNITTTEVDGTMGSGYLCSYIYYEPESVIKAFEKLARRRE